MSSKDKEKTFQEKLKNFFRLNRGSFKSRSNYTLTPERERDLRPEAPLSQRIKIIKELSETVMKCRLEERCIQKLWASLQDLLHKEVPKEHRHLTFSFFCCLIQGQFDKLDIMRAQFFNLVKTHDISEDTIPRFELLQSLTENGKEIRLFEEEMPRFMLDWMPAILITGKTHEFLSMLVNLIKYNAAYVDKEIIIDFVQNTCYLCCWGKSQDVVLTGLEVLDTVVCYSNLPSESVRIFIYALCRTVNVEAYCQTSWKIMRNLLGTHKGHTTLYTMCSILQDTSPELDVYLLRGAVFYVNMSLWSNKRVTSLKLTPTAVLPSLLKVLSCNSSIVVYEVIQSIERLVSKFGIELLDASWDLILSIMETIMVFIEAESSSESTPEITSHLHETFNHIEVLIEQGKFNGCVPRVYELIERCSTGRPDESVLRLLNHLSTFVIATRPVWIHKLKNMMEKYYKQDARTCVRVKVLDVLLHALQCNRPVYEDDLIERIVIPYLLHVETETDVVVRNMAAQLLVDICMECETKRCLEVMELLEKLLNRPFELPGDVVFTSEVDIMDVKSAIAGLIKIFTTKIFQLPSSHAIKAYKLLVNHLEAHYQKPDIFDYTSSIRYLIFECFLKLRASEHYLGYPVSGRYKYSAYLALDSRDGDKMGGSISPPPMSPAPSSYPTSNITRISLHHACNSIISCLKNEKDWKVLELVLQEIPKVLKNKALILTRSVNEIDSLASAVCSMISDKLLKLPEKLRMPAAPEKTTTTVALSRSEFHSYVFPVLVSLASYHVYIEPNLQQKLIRCLQVGLTSRFSRQCVVGITTIALEMRDAMNKLLPEVLLNLSKISATIHIAIPLLEFLSTLTRLPKVFSSFVGDQYMSVFAISMPYTNPFKYNHYIVSLAYHVISVWFLKCRLPFRRDFVKFITMGLKANVIIPFEEGQLMKSTEIVNEDSSNRKRSSSLTEQGTRRNIRGPPGARSDIRPPDCKPVVDDALMNFHIELTEMCIDLMARYTFSTCSALPKRMPTADFLLNGGQSMTWLLGNKLITISTSGCSQKVLKNGLCDKCWLLCWRNKTEVQSPDGNTAHVQKPALQRTSSIDVTAATLEGVRSEESSLPSSVASQSCETPVSRSFRLSGNAASVSSTPATAATSPVDDTRKVIGDVQESEPNRLDQLLFGPKDEKPERQFCSCWCQGWAEIHIRRPTGDMSWIMRIQNQCYFQTTPYELPLEDITTLFMPSLANREQLEELMPGVKKIDIENSKESDYEAMLDQHFGDDHESSTSGCHVLDTSKGPTDPIHIPGSPVKHSPSRQSSRESVDDGNELEDGERYETDDGGKSRNSVRRSNSSPEMSASWKNPFLNGEREKKDCKNQKRELIADPEIRVDGALDSKKSAKQKDPRVSCEAIPEEVAGQGSTPPSVIGHHPSLLACHSYPGTEVEPQSSEPSSTSHTVPPSPSSLVSPPSILSSQRSTPTTPAISGVNPVIHQSSLSLSKPPLSPSPQNRNITLTSPRDIKTPPDSSRSSQQSSVHSFNISNVDSSKEERPDPSTLPPLSFRNRGHTISVMSPVRKPAREWNSNRENTPRGKEPPRSGISPSFIFLQLYHAAHFGSTSEKPLLISQSQPVQRAVKILDRIPPYETHKIGVIYVGTGQASNEAEILRNEFGSLRYNEFLQNLGTLVKLRDVDSQNVFLGGLDQNGNDGLFAYVWQDDVMQVIFHVATLMPTKESDPSCTNKKLHIGNDFVIIVYNESGEDYNIQTVKCQFSYACIEIQPLEYQTSQITVKTRSENLSSLIGHSEPKIVSDQNVAILARQLALHANLASMVSQSLMNPDTQDPYASNWLERLRKIKRIKNKALHELSTATSNDNTTENVSSPPRLSRRVPLDDFTEYT